MANLRKMATGEVFRVANTKVDAESGRLRFSVRGNDCPGARFFAQHPYLSLVTEADGTHSLAIADGYAVAGRGARSSAKPKQPEITPEITPAQEAECVNNAAADLAAGKSPSYVLANLAKIYGAQVAGRIMEAALRRAEEGAPAPTKPAPAPTPAQKPEPTPTPTPAADIAAIRAAVAEKYGEFGGGIIDAVAALTAAAPAHAAVDEQQVRAIVDEAVAKLAPRRVQIAVADGPAKDAPADAHTLLPSVVQMVVNDRSIGRFPWLHGPAGSGKSTLAKQVADTLGLPFYSVSSLQQKYELEGYADASGAFVETSFYKAFSQGGVFCFDEASTSPAEVQVAFNTALAQLRYNFPVVGMVDAHKDFHVIAADNTMGRGQDARYTARYQLDASSLDRYVFVEVGYNRELELRLAGGDEAMVDFIHAVRKALDAAQLTYTATPRCLRAMSAFIAMGMPLVDVVRYGVCSGWDAQDTRTIAARLADDGNKYVAAFKQAAKAL